MPRISEARVLILATDGFEESELFEPLEILVREGAEVKVEGLNEASETIVDKLAIHDEPGAFERLMGH